MVQIQYILIFFQEIFLKDKYYYEYCIGGKTGYTKKARRTLVSASKKNDKTLIVVTLNDPNDFKNHKTYYENNFKKYNLVNILSKDKFKSLKGIVNFNSDTQETKNSHKRIFSELTTENLEIIGQDKPSSIKIFLVLVISPFILILISIRL